MNRIKGIVMIIVGAMLWGATGPMMQWMLSEFEITVSFMLIIRLIIAGAALLIILKIQGKQITLPWRQKIWARDLLIFGVVGMLGVQYSFVASIHTSNAVMATLFQFLAPIYIIAFVSLSQRKLPPIVQVSGMVVTLFGLVLLLTNGSFEEIALSNEAIAWGAILGFSFAFYTLYPVRLMQEWGVLLVVGWAMVIGGIALFLSNPMIVINEVASFSNIPLLAMLIFVIIVGTTAFVLFLGSMKYISPVETSILSSFEPLTAMVISVLWFGQVLGLWQLSGAIVMLIGVTWLSIAGSKLKKEGEPDPM